MRRKPAIQPLGKHRTFLQSLGSRDMVITLHSRASASFTVFLYYTFLATSTAVPPPPCQESEGVLGGEAGLLAAEV